MSGMRLPLCRWLDEEIKFVFQDENLKEVHQMIEMEDSGVDQKLKALFEQLQQGKIGCILSRQT